MSRYKPVGWRNDNYRHSLAARGYRTALRAYRGPLGQNQFIMSDISPRTNPDTPIDEIRMKEIKNDIKSEIMRSDIESKQKEEARNLYMDGPRPMSFDDMIYYQDWYTDDEERNKQIDKIIDAWRAAEVRSAQRRRQGA